MNVLASHARPKHVRLTGEIPARSTSPGEMVFQKCLNSVNESRLSTSKLIRERQCIGQHHCFLLFGNLGASSNKVG